MKEFEWLGMATLEQPGERQEINEMARLSDSAELRTIACERAVSRSMVTFSVSRKIPENHGARVKE